MGRLEAKVALITGGAAGLGRAVATRFVREGARVVILDRDQERLLQVRGELGDSVVAVHGDVTRYEDNARAVQAAIETFSHLDVFVGNAGVFDNRVGLVDLPADRLSDAFDELFSVDVKGYLLGAKACMAELERSQGAIIFTASVSSFFPGFGGILYIAAKHAVLGITRQLAFELKPRIRVNAVAPGFIPTDLHGLQSLGQGPKANRPRRPEEFPLQFVPTTEDYTSLYVLLASSEEARLLSGVAVLADGGQALLR